jgi:hypothetical protein
VEAQVGDESSLSFGAQRWVLHSERANATIGRDPAAEINLDSDELVSRQHARLTYSGGVWSIADYGSRNGTRVNGQQLTTSRRLQDNDRIHIGQAVLTFHGPAAAAQPGPQTAAPSATPAAAGSGGRVRLVKIMIIAGLVEGIGLAANSVAAFVADHAGGPVRWLAPPGLALITAMVVAVVQAVSKEPAASSTSTTRTATTAGRRRGTPAAAAILVVLVVVGIGGFAAAAGVQYAAGYITGKESGEDRLVREVSKSGSGLVLTVEQVVHTSHFTRLEVTVRNTTDSAIGLPLFGYCTLSASDGTTLEADSFRSHWTEQIPPGPLQRATITFPGHLPANQTTASLSFSQVFSLGGKAFTVTGIKLKPVET